MIQEMFTFHSHLNKYTESKEKYILLVFHLQIYMIQIYQRNATYFPKHQKICKAFLRYFLDNSKNKYILRSLKETKPCVPAFEWLVELCKYFFPTLRT